MLTRTRSQRSSVPTDVVGPDSVLVRELTKAYWHELESVTNHLASSTNRVGVGAEQIADSIRQVIAADLKHAQQAAIRIGQLHGAPPSTDEFAARKLHVRPPAEPLDGVSALTSLIEAETTAIARYRRIAALAPEAYDSVTHALANQIVREKQIHHESLASFLASSFG